jgi:hypothetical protein
MDESDEFVALRVSRRRAQLDEWVLVLSAEGLRTVVRGGPTGFVLEVAARDALDAERAAAWRARAGAPRPGEPVPPTRAQSAVRSSSRFLSRSSRDRTRRPIRLGVGERASADARASSRVSVARRHAARCARICPCARQRDGRGALLSAVFRAFASVAAAHRLAAALASPMPSYRRAFPCDDRRVDGVFSASACWPPRTRASGPSLAKARVAADRRGARARDARHRGQRVDLWAHGLGLAAGVVLGALASGMPARWFASRAFQSLAGASALAALAIAWAFALRA